MSTSQVRRTDHTPSRLELIAELDQFANSQLTQLLPTDRIWQPAHLLPDLTNDHWLDALQNLRQQAALLPDSVLVTLVANMITEEALPSYHSWLGHLEAAHGGIDPTGIGDGGLARWTRWWVAEEKRHGEVLGRWLYASGRVDMGAIERTIQHLLRNGFDPKTENCMIRGFIYTSFQERATFIAHQGTGRLARDHGATDLARICEHIAGDEVRHERAYERFVAKLFELDPDATMIAFADMLRKTIIMPSSRMNDGSDMDLYGHFSALTQSTGIYTTNHYAAIMEHLIRLWHIETLTDLSPAAAAAQTFVATLPARYAKLANRAAARLGQVQPQAWSWLKGRVVA